jgi:monovalent cation/hydrogen antiporter
MVGNAGDCFLSDRSCITNGLPIEGRNEVIFITFVVILLTLLIPGLTLPHLIRLLKIQEHSKKEVERNVRNELVKVAEDNIQQLLKSKVIGKEEYEFLKIYFTTQHRVLEMSHEGENFENFETARIKVLHSQRKKLLEMWERQEIDDKLLNHLENELDMLEVHIARAEL